MNGKVKYNPPELFNCLYPLSAFLSQPLRDKYGDFFVTSKDDGILSERFGLLGCQKSVWVLI